MKFAPCCKHVWCERGDGARGQRSASVDLRFEPTVEIWCVFSLFATYQVIWTKMWMHLLRRTMCWKHAVKSWCVNWNKELCCLTDFIQPEKQDKTCQSLFFFFLQLIQNTQFWEISVSMNSMNHPPISPCSPLVLLESSVPAPHKSAEMVFTGSFLRDRYWQAEVLFHCVHQYTQICVQGESQFNIFGEHYLSPLISCSAGL